MKSTVHRWGFAIMHNAPTSRDVAAVEAQAGTGAKAGNGTDPGTKSNPDTARLPVTDTNAAPDADRTWDISDWFRIS